jgi:hypothetical protein
MLKSLAVSVSLLVTDPFPLGLSLTCFSPAKELYGLLKTQYKERPVWYGLATPGVLMQIWSGSDTFTITMESSNTKTACVMGSGEHSDFIQLKSGTEL